MDEINLRVMLQRSREFEQQIGSVTFRCRIPTMAQAQRAYARYEGPGRFTEGMQDLLSECVLLVKGATARDVGLDSDDPLPETQEWAREYLAEHVDAANMLALELGNRSRERQQRIEGTAKN